MNEEPFEFTLQNFIESKADIWNSRLASHLDMTVEALKDIIMQRNLDVITEDVSHRINKKYITETYNNLYETLGATESFHNYVLEFSDNDFEPKALSITGKIIIGLNFTRSILNESYFNNCILYKCNFTSTAFETCVFNSCVFNNCVLDSSDFTSSTFYRSRFYECSMSDCIFDYSVINDCMFTVCRMPYIQMKQVKLLATGFVDCEIFSSDLKDANMILVSMSNCDLSKCSLRRASLIDGIFIRVNMKECDFSQMSITALTTTCCDYAVEHANLFEISHGLYSPSTFEWDEQGEERDNLDLGDGCEY